MVSAQTKIWLPFVLLLVLALALLLSFAARADEQWIKPGANGQAQVQLYFFWSLTCPHCTAAHPHVAAIPAVRPWVTLHELSVSSNPDNARRFQEIVEQGGMEDAAGVPARWSSPAHWVRASSANVKGGC